jgi:hypothetical protein
LCIVLTCSWCVANFGFLCMVADQARRWRQRRARRPVDYRVVITRFARDKFSNARRSSTKFFSWRKFTTYVRTLSEFIDEELQRRSPGATAEQLLDELFALGTQWPREYQNRPVGSSTVGKSGGASWMKNLVKCVSGIQAEPPPPKTLKRSRSHGRPVALSGAAVAAAAHGESPGLCEGRSVAGRGGSLGEFSHLPPGDEQRQIRYRFRGPLLRLVQGRGEAAVCDVDRTGGRAVRRQRCCHQIDRREPIRERP